MASGFASFFSRDKTFRPGKKDMQEGTLRYELHRRANDSLHSGLDLRQVVKLPAGEELNDWLAVHVVDFFNRINVVYGVVSEFCTDESCPVMSGGPKYEYHWCDGVRYKKPTRCTAPQYVELMMEWVEQQINDEYLFPVATGVSFPKSYLSMVKKIMKRLFRVFVHIYIHHFDSLVTMGAEAHINTCYKHFYHFVTEFNLVDKKELEPLKEMSLKLCP